LSIGTATKGAAFRKLDCRATHPARAAVGRELDYVFDLNHPFLGGDLSRHALLIGSNDQWLTVQIIATCRWRAVRRSDSKVVTFTEPEVAKFRPTDACRIFQHSAEHRLKLAR
jgi:hypothetical protein